MSLIEINRQPSVRDLRIFSALLMVFGGLIGWWLARRSGSELIGTGAGLLIALTGLAGLLWRELARRVYVGWMIAVSPIGFVVSTLILALVFYGVVWPIGFCLRRRGRDALALRLDRSAASYWIRRRNDPDPRRYFRQF